MAAAALINHMPNPSNPDINEISNVCTCGSISGFAPRLIVPRPAVDRRAMNVLSVRQARNLTGASFLKSQGAFYLP